MAKKSVSVRLTCLVYYTIRCSFTVNHVSRMIVNNEPLFTFNKRVRWCYVRLHTSSPAAGCRSLILLSVARAASNRTRRWREPTIDNSSAANRTTTKIGQTWLHECVAQFRQVLTQCVNASCTPNERRQAVPHPEFVRYSWRNSSWLTLILFQKYRFRTIFFMICTARAYSIKWKFNNVTRNVI